MSSELALFFPSSTHPAYYIANNILSTLRNLTAPGKGNDIKAEERAALVGVSSLLACEKIQSKDLVEKTAQKASSVSPAHFRSALRRARELLLAQPDNETPGGRSTTRRSSSTRNVNTTGDSGQSNAIASSSTPSPFSTPKKKFKYSSGVDLSGLIKHTPTKGSPLKQSVTPSRKRDLPSDREEGPPQVVLGELIDDDEEEDGVQDIQTPTKVRDVTSIAEGSAKRSSKRGIGEEDMAAFFALRPGTSTTSSPAISAPARFRGYTDTGMTPRTRVPRTEDEKKRRRIRKKKDWTFKEELWGGEAMQRRNERILKRVSVL